MVDDEHMNIIALEHNLKMALRNMGRDPLTLENLVDNVGDGTEAVRKFKAQAENETPYVLVFMDCSMEPMDGYTASLLIKEYCQETEIHPPYIVACTGHTEESYVQKAWDSKMDELIPKPCRIEELEKVLQETIDFVY